MKRILLLLQLAAWQLQVSGQNDSGLLKEAEQALQEGKTTVSAVLTDKKYMLLHPLPAFRDLIRQYGDTGILHLSPAEEPGKRILVSGTLAGTDGTALAGITLYVYQTDARGWYAADRPHITGNEGDRRHARLFGYMKTDREGKFIFSTVKPAGYPLSELPAHIHVEVTNVTGYRPLVTEFLFGDDERLTAILRSRALRAGHIIAGPANAPGPYAQQFSYALILARER